MVQANGIELAVAVTGQGPLVILMHGWPEQSLSWRHLAPALAAAGYRVATPDMRGYGASGKPEAVDAYRLNTLAQDMGAIADALGEQRFVAVGHDWGAITAWRTALYYPDRVAAVLGMSVPHSAPPPIPLLDVIDHLYPDRFFYIRYFQPPGVAEAELENSDLTHALKMIYWTASGPGARAHVPRNTPRDATLLQSWDEPPPGELAFLPDAELAQYVARFAAGGWRGPLNYYRNFAANADDARALGDSIIRQPSAFLYGEYDAVLHFFPGQLEHMRAHLADMRGEYKIAGAGHWVQQEAPAETNAAVLEFVNSIRNQV
jgi:pimeloyl-ACP methyl ester carboxylesterase